jgi:tetratricopeptide (TPR) repeat protein
VQSLFGFTMVGSGSLLVTAAALLSRWGETIDVPDEVAGQRLVGRRAAIWLRPAQAAVWASAAFVAFVGVVRPFLASRECQRGDLLLPSDPQQAIACFEEAAVENTECYWTKLGSALQSVAENAPSAEQQSLLVRANDAFTHAEELVPVNAYNHANLGGVRVELAARSLVSPAEVYDCFERALALDPANVYFHRDAATAALRLGDTSRARRHIEQGLALYPEYGPLNAQMGYLRLQEGRLQEAVPCLERAHATPDLEGNSMAWLGASATLAVTLERLQRLDEALRVATAVVAREPRWAYGHMVLGEVLERLGRGAEAVGEYEQVIEQVPTHAIARTARQKLRRLK